MKRSLLVSGSLTSIMLYAAIAPRAALLALFGSALEGPVAEVVVRNWGALLALFGAAMIYCAFQPAARPLIVTLAIVGKLIFISLILSQGRRFLGHLAGAAVLVDTLIVVVLALCLIGSWRAKRSP